MFDLKLDKRHKIPLYKQIVTSIEEAIASKKLKHLDMLPSIELFSSYLQVSDIVIRQAYKTLESKKLIKKISGKGTFIHTRPMITIPFQEFYETAYFFSDIHDQLKRTCHLVEHIGEDTFVKMTARWNEFPIYHQHALMKGHFHQDIQAYLDQPDSIYTVFHKLTKQNTFVLESFFYARQADSQDSYLLDIAVDAPIYYIVTSIKNDQDDILATVYTTFPAEYIAFEASI